MNISVDESWDRSDGQEAGAVPRTHSVLIIEDDPNTRDYIAHALDCGEAPYAVRTAASLQAGFESLERDPPDVMLVDLGLPDGNGVELIRRAREKPADIHVMVITVFGDEATVVGAIEAGAHGYLLKSEAPEDLRLSVDQVLAGGAPISPGIASHLLRRFTERQAPRDASREVSSLTDRERDVLDLIVKGLPYQEAAEALGITRNTVASHVKSIYRKLEVGSRGEAVFEALSRGLVKVDSND